jgi:hypothetical protein
VPVLANGGGDLAAALRPARPLSSAVAFYKGMPVRPALARALGVEATRLDQILGDEA